MPGRGKCVTLARMTTDVAASEDPRVYRARAHAAQHRIDQAETLYREIIRANPKLAEAWNFIGMCELGRGELDAAREHLERAAAAEPTEAEIWKNVGIVNMAQGRGEDAVDAFDRALGIEPMHFAARLHRGAALEQLGRLDAAAAAYFGAVATAQIRGKWLNDVSTPPQMRLVVRHAIAFVDKHRKRIFRSWLQPLRAQHRAGALTRIERALDIYLGDREPGYPDAHQDCTFLYVPDLTTAPDFPRERLPWCTALESRAAEIRQELAGVLAQPIGMEPFLGTNDNARLKENHLLESLHGKAAWNAFFFQRHGKPVEDNRARCPRTVAALDRLPLMQLDGHAPRALFSIVAPGTHVMPRHGVTNARLTTSLPLQVPPGCTFSVGGVEHALREGQCFTFDDTFEHELWNRSDLPCAVLSFDTWHPDLTAVERAAIAVLTLGIGDFNRVAKVDPPSAD